MGRIERRAGCAARRARPARTSAPSTALMPCTCVVGLQWGDEAKGKIVDLLSEQHHFVVRYNGGANAGHTVVRDGHTYKLSLLPTGVLVPSVRAVIRNRVLIYPPRPPEYGARPRGAPPLLQAKPRAELTTPFPAMPPPPGPERQTSL